MYIAGNSRLTDTDIHTFIYAYTHTCTHVQIHIWKYTYTIILLVLVSLNILLLFSDTVSRSGVYCAVSNAIEQCKTEGVVDVFQATKAVRLHKPGAVTTLVSYIYLM